MQVVWTLSSLALVFQLLNLDILPHLNFISLYNIGCLVKGTLYTDRFETVHVFSSLYNAMHMVWTVLSDEFLKLEILTKHKP